MLIKKNNLLHNKVQSLHFFYALNIIVVSFLIAWDELLYAFVIECVAFDANHVVSGLEEVIDKFAENRLAVSLWWIFCFRTLLRTSTFVSKRMTIWKVRSHHYSSWMFSRPTLNIFTTSIKSNHSSSFVHKLCNICDF